MDGGLESQWFGGDVQAASRKAAARSAAAVAARVVMAKPFPGVADRVRTLASSPTSSALQVARVLEGDASLCARLLRLVNSAGYALRVKCSSVRHAVALAGLDNIRNLVTSASVLELFDPKTRPSVEILSHCAQVGSLCRYLGSYLSLPQEMLFTCGFMHDIGKLMLLEVHGEDYSALLESACGDVDASYTAEQISLGFDHALLGAAVIRKWRIPDPVPSVVEGHHDFTSIVQLGGELAQLVAVVRLADGISHDLERGLAEPSERTSERSAADYLGISPQQLSAMWADLDAVCSRTRKLVDKNETEWLECQSLVPRKPEAKSRPDDSESEGEEVPETYACHVCGVASFGEMCPLCHAHVCTDHGGAREGWCDVCAAEYAAGQRGTKRNLPLAMALVMLATGVCASVLGTMAGLRAGTEEVVGSGLLVVLSGVVGGAFYQSWARVRFLRRMSRRQVKAGAAQPTSMAMAAGRLLKAPYDQRGIRIEERCENEGVDC